MNTGLFTILALLPLQAYNDNNKTAAPQLSEAETEDLMFIIQEEKLARDVYLFPRGKHVLRVFGNISSGEQGHLAHVQTLLNQFGLENPVEGLGVGEYNDPVFTRLYEQLTARSALSLVDALTVGAYIEELDIRDLRELGERTDHPDILQVYENLECGSRNHLRAFNFQLSNQGIAYTPEILSEEVFEQIIQSNHAQCGYE